MEKHALRWVLTIGLQRLKPFGRQRHKLIGAPRHCGRGVRNCRRARVSSDGRWRVALFCETARVFLKGLRKESGKKFGAVPEGLRRRYLRADGGPSRYHDAKSSEARRRISVCARDVWRFVDRFKGDEAARALGSYGLLKRLLDEQCELVEEAPTRRAGDADVNDPPAPVAVKPAKVRARWRYSFRPTAA